MDKIMDFILCAGVTAFEVVAIIVGAMLIQLIVYQLTGISLFNRFTKLMFRADRYITAKFN